MHIATIVHRALVAVSLAAALTAGVAPERTTAIVLPPFASPAPSAPSAPSAPLHPSGLHVKRLPLAMKGLVFTSKPGLPQLARAPQKNVTYGYYLSTVLWPTRPIPVCWNLSASDYQRFAVQRELVQRAISSTWSAVSTARFVGWQQCGQSAVYGFGIGVQDVDPHSAGLGTQLNGNLNGVVLNFTYADWDPSCATQRAYCDTVIAVHEFGHALGLAHEQNRPDTPHTPICTADPQGESGDTTVGSWDLHSVMNYCNPQWNGNGKLSGEDMLTIQLMYGAFQDPPISPVLYGFPNETVGNCDVSNASMTLFRDGNVAFRAGLNAPSAERDYVAAGFTLYDGTGQVVDTILPFKSPVIEPTGGSLPWTFSIALPEAETAATRRVKMTADCLKS